MVHRFYKSISQSYTHANEALLSLLLQKQHLIAHLRLLKHFFFLAHSSYLTHFLDLAGSELRKSARGASLVKLQSLLELAMGGEGGAVVHREEEKDDSVEVRAGAVAEMGKVRVTMAQSGLYEWLLKVVSVSGVIGSGKEDGNANSIADDAASSHAQEDRKDKDDKKDKGMLAIDALTLDYIAPFPLSLVISRKTVLRYQLLFRFLLHLRSVEMSLCTMWGEHKLPVWRKSVNSVTFRSARAGTTGTAEGKAAGTRMRSHSRAAATPSPAPSAPTPDPSTPHPTYQTTYVQTEFDRWRNRVFLLRARMLAFVQQILSFATVEVLEPNWRKLEERLGSVKTVDELLRDHVDFLDTCLKECMLTSSKLLRVYFYRFLSPHRRILTSR